MNIGDWIVQRPTAGDHRCEIRRGRVVYVHPEGRFYTLEFTYERGASRLSFRESFLTGQPIEDPTDWFAAAPPGRTSRAKAGPSADG